MKQSWINSKTDERFRFYYETENYLKFNILQYEMDYNTGRYKL